MSVDDRQREGLAEGTVVDGRYRIESELGRGGFARVYRATHADLGRAVALKVIELPQHPGAVSPFVRRFRREAQIVAALAHPNIVTVYDFGEVDETGQPYLAMQLLDGIDLEMRLAHGGPLEPARAIGLMAEVLDALAEAQRQGIVHKDLKPSNLFLVHEGTDREKLVLIDFGIARIWDDDDSRVTQTGGFTGTPAYFAPEYVEKQIVTPAIDVYQCGLILVELMTGLPAVIAENSMQYLMKHCRGDVNIPQELLDSELGPVLTKALAVDHTVRYADCGAFREALLAVDRTKVPTPRRSHGGPLVTPNDTLERTPNTGDFARELAEADTVAAPPMRELDSAELQPQPQRSPMGIAVVAGLLVVMLFGVALVWTRPKAPVPAATVVEFPEPPEPAAPASAAVENAADAAVPVTPPVEPARIEAATIVSTPAGAVVEIDGIRYGPTPLEIAGPLLDGSPHRLRLHHPGSRPFGRRVVFEAGATHEFELKPRARVRQEREPERNVRPKAPPAAIAN